MQDLLKPNFVAFLVKQVNTVLVIEDAEKVITNRNHQTGPSVVSTLLQLTDGLFSDYLKIKVICTFNTDLSKIDTALFRKGRLLASYAFSALTPDRVAALLGSDADQGMTVGSATLGDIFHREEQAFAPARERRIGFR